MAKGDDVYDTVNAAIGAAGGAAAGGVVGRVMSRAKMQGGRGVFRRQFREGDLIVRNAEHAASLRQTLRELRPDEVQLRRKIEHALKRWEVRRGLTRSGAAGGAILGGITGGVAGRDRR